MDDVCDSFFMRVLPVYGDMTKKTILASLLMLLNTILMGVVVVVGAYVPRYRRHPVIGGLFLAAATLFLPIVSIIATNLDGVRGLLKALGRDHCDDNAYVHLLLVFLWTGVVVVIGINASAVVAADAREGRNINPPVLLLAKGIWTAYLTFSTVGPDYYIVSPLYVIMFAKLVFKYAAFYKARRSFALGRNPCLVAGYMAQLQQLAVVHDDGHTEIDTDTRAPPPPALIVMGEDKVQVEQQPHGYNLKQMPNDQQGDCSMTRAASRLVTLDRVWEFGGMEARSKDLCFSFALFKLLRCRFAKYTVSEAGFIKNSQFFKKTLLQNEDHYDRVFGLIKDELSFINDYYYSSLPIHYSHPLLPALGVMLSLCSIGNSIFIVVLIGQAFNEGFGNYGQISLSCDTKTACSDADGLWMEVGSFYYDAVPLCLVVFVLLLAEARDIVSYFCSNWTKVALIYHHVNQVWWQRYRVVQKCIFALVKYRCKLVNNWDDKMKQCSILVLRPRKTPLRRLCHPLRFVGVHKKVKVPNAVKAAIFQAIKGERLFTTEHWLIPPPSSPIPALHLYVCNNGEHPASYSILVWHIATSVFEASQHQQPSESDHNKTVATHLSHYCTYLVSIRPELLPDDAEWCHKLYDQVKKDADRVLAKVQGVGHDQLIQVLSADSSHGVLRNGAMLGEQLVKHYSNHMGWEKLARFWVEMILYVAPSENLEAHAEAISHGGELITLLWAMLAHAGITGRQDAAGVGAAAEEGREVC